MSSTLGPPELGSFPPSALAGLSSSASHWKSCLYVKGYIMKGDVDGLKDRWPRSHSFSVEGSGVSPLQYL